MADPYFIFSLAECRITLNEWHNSSKHHNLPLISDDFIKPVKEAIRKAAATVESVTMTLPNCSGRYVPRAFYERHQMLDIMSVTEQVVNAVLDLKRNWDGVISDAKERFGELFDVTEYPEPDELEVLYRYKCSISLNEGINDNELYITTIKLYENYSLFSAEDIAEEIVLERKFEAIRNRNSE